MAPTDHLDKPGLLRSLLEHPLAHAAFAHTAAASASAGTKASVSFSAGVKASAHMNANAANASDGSALAESADVESLAVLLSRLARFDTSDPEAAEGLWRLCTKAKSALPEGDRLENLSWRLLHISLKSKRRTNNDNKTISRSTTVMSGERSSVDEY
ncbi:hypothetical protein HDU82_001121 [Entophlyctis luteolus]|nr:hypothetical protein HDU82_001121 [Entophlyctis luteolus]